MARACRKAAAIVILSTGIGALIEAEIPDGRLTRAPLTGFIVLGVGAVIAWATDELAKGDDDA